jgi:YbbR domain-containing protein
MKFCLKIIVFFLTMILFSNNNNNNNNSNRKNNNKGTVVPVRIVKAYEGSGGIDPLILNFDTRWR